MAPFHYVYILTSVGCPSRHSTGLTRNLAARLRDHNAGKVLHTSKLRPWRIETAISFTCPKKAAAFEAYLKTHSGRGFAARHL